MKKLVYNGYLELADLYCNGYIDTIEEILEEVYKKPFRERTLRACRARVKTLYHSEVMASCGVDVVASFSVSEEARVGSREVLGVGINAKVC